MEPRIAYTRSPDGVSIACWTLGEGPPVVLMPNMPFSSIELEWRNRPCREWYAGLAERYQLIGYDARGSGLSQRDALDFSLEAQVLDLSAVVSRYALERFALIGVVHSCPPAITYSARFPERVGRLILWGPYVRGSDYLKSPRIQAVRSLLRQDWQLFADAVGFFSFGWHDQRQAQGMRTWVEGCTDQATTIRITEAMDRFDASPALAAVEAPTLVMRRRKAAWPPPEAATEVATAIPDARLALLEGEATAPWGEPRAQLEALIAEFIDADLAVPADGSRATPLTERELEVLRLVAAGLGNKEIAAHLHLSVHTIERHLGNIYTKTDTRGRADATSYAHRHGLV